MLKRMSKPMRRRSTITFWIGLAIIIACESLLLADVLLSHRSAIHTNDEFVALPPTSGAIAKTARWTATNITAIIWTGLLLLLDGLLVRFGRGSPARQRPHHFSLLWIASSFIWCVFDLINFWVFAPHHAWRYIGMPAAFADR